MGRAKRETAGERWREYAHMLSEGEGAGENCQGVRDTGDHKVGERRGAVEG